MGAAARLLIQRWPPVGGAVDADLKVQSCLLSGLETYYLRSCDYKFLDLQLGKKLRAVLRARACSKQDERYAARTGDSVFQEFRMVPS